MKREISKNFILESNKEDVLKDLDTKIPIILEKWGLVAERYAKESCPVDTGLLRNSITHAIGGQPFSVKSYHAEKGKGRGGSFRIGFYKGSPGESGDNAVYIGTNVEYAPYVEFGTNRQRPQPFIKPSVMNHLSQYKEIMKKELDS